MPTFPRFLFILSCALLVHAPLRGQVPDWQPNRQLTGLPSYIACSQSDGFGQHVLSHTGSTFGHYLLSNHGIIIPGNSGKVFPRRETDFGASITSYNGTVSIVTDSSNRLRLYQTANGGESWSLTATFTPDYTIQILNVDAFADFKGVHITWDNSTADSVYYVRYDAVAQQFLNFKNVTDTLAVTGYGPKVLGVSDRTVVAFIRGTSTTDTAMTRELIYSSGAWEGYKKAGFAHRPKNIGIARRGDTLHMVMKTSPAPTHRTLWASKRSINGAAWDTPVMLINYGDAGGESNFRRPVTVVDDTVYGTYSKSGATDLDSSLKFLYYKKSDPWPHSSYFSVAKYTGTAQPWQRETITSSRTGAYVFYSSAGSPAAP